MNDHFVYGFLFAVIAISGLLALQYGDNFNFLNDDGFTVLPSFGTALNWKSAICLSLLFGLFFKTLKGSYFVGLTDGSDFNSICVRCFYAFWILCLGWAVMDLFWILKAALTGNFLFGSMELTFISADQLLTGLIRNSCLIIISLLVSLKFLKFNKASILCFAGVVAYWIFLIWSFPYAGYFFNSFIVYGVNFLPFVYCLKNWSEFSWRKFLFV